MLYTKPNICNINRPAPDPEYIYRELKRKHVTLTLLWHEYKQAHPDGLMLSQYCERYRKWRGSLDISMHQDHKAGESSVLLVNSSCVIFAVSGDYCQVIPVGNTCMIVGDH